MKRERVVSVAMTETEDKEFNIYMAKLTIEREGERVTKSDIMREALMKYIRNGKPEAEQDDKQDDEQEPAELSPEEPTDLEHNPFADLNFDS